MAGSYKHIVDDDGGLLSNKEFIQMIENLGDAYEMAEEMYGMIWFLAQGHPDRVEEARQNYRVGLSMAPGGQRD